MRYTFIIIAAIFLFSCHRNADATKRTEVTAEMAYEGVSNYCHETYDWSVAAGDSAIMSVTMGEETDSAFLVVFRSYTGAYVNFFVEKGSGKTRLVENVPALGVQNDAGTIDLFDYVER